MLELLSPVGSFENLKMAVQNGADSVYFGASSFSARAFANNFNIDELKEAIEYAKLRGVKTLLTLNTLIKNEELNSAFELAKKAYEFGIDGIIIQDLGLASMLHRYLPDLPLHASTQMTIHNLEGALLLEKLGFKRVVLSRELSINEILHIRKNTKIELECFIHGALCISYSGQCLLSSIIGGRSGNRGKCAQPCRLPYTLYENNTKLDNGYLLSTKDLLGLDYIPTLLKNGINCVKIEGRMKSPEYVATVTRIYRKYINLANSDNPYIIDEEDKKSLLQIFNRGLSSCGHLSNEANHNLIYKEKPNNMGLPLGIVEKYNSTKGHITIKLKENLSIGDTISLENETGTYHISELMIKNQNIKDAHSLQTVTIGRMKGNIKLGDKVYKLSSKYLNTLAQESIKNENRKINLNCEVIIKKDTPISIKVTSNNNLNIYKNLNITCNLDILPITAKNKPLEKEQIIKQISKTNSTIFNFSTINVILDENIFIPKLSSINELRRIALDKVLEIARNNIQRNTNLTPYDNSDIHLTKNGIKTEKAKTTNTKISVLLNILNEDFDYSKLNNIDNIYIPLKYFINKNYKNILNTISNKFNIYIYLPTIIKSNYKNFLFNNIENTIKTYHIKGFILSNISNIFLLDDIIKSKKFEIIANYTFNIFNNETTLKLEKLGINKYTISPELDKQSIDKLENYNNINKELIIYGNTPLMNMNYCLLGKSNKCYPTCKSKCNSKNIYYIKDRIGMNFRIIPDNMQTVTTIYNSKITSISPKDFNIEHIRIDILDETIDEINNIINTIKQGNKLTGKEYTNGNLNTFI